MLLDTVLDINRYKYQCCLTTREHPGWILACGLCFGLESTKSVSQFEVVHFWNNLLPLFPQNLWSHDVKALRFLWDFMKTPNISSLWTSYGITPLFACGLVAKRKTWQKSSKTNCRLLLHNLKSTECTKVDMGCTRVPFRASWQSVWEDITSVLFQIVVIGCSLVNFAPPKMSWIKILKRL